MMLAQPDDAQRIVRLTPLGEALACLDTVAPVAARMVPLSEALGRVLAQDIAVNAAQPTAALALRDGWAVAAEALGDASSYAPVPLAAVPRQVETGTTLPLGTDAVAEYDAIQVEGGRAAAIAPVASGDGVLPPEADAFPGVRLRRAGTRLRRHDLAVWAAFGIQTVPARVPRIRLVRAGRGGAVAEAACSLVASAAAALGALVIADPADALEPALHHEAVDAVIAVGGTGAGRSDDSVRVLARNGTLRFHGVGLSPGETAAFGFVAARPVLILPGRLDAALAVWLALGRALLTRLSAATEEDVPISAELARKVASPVGIASLVPIRWEGSTAEPLATGYLPLQSLAQADGWILVPAEREGYPAGAPVMVRALP